MHDNGNGVRRDPYEAVRWFRKAAEKGQPWGQVLLAGMYLMGRGVECADETKAIAWIKRAAEQGHAGAQFDLGCHYSKPNPEFVGYVRLKNMPKSTVVQKGFPLDLRVQMLSAQRQYGKTYHGSEFIPLNDMTVSERKIVNYVEAYKWFTLAASKRGAEAMQVSNSETAFDLMTEMCANGATQMRDALHNILSEGQIEQAENLVSQW
jgi:TPR repeat protein